MQSYPASRDMLSLAASGITDMDVIIIITTRANLDALGEDLNTQPPVGRALTSYDDL